MSKTEIRDSHNSTHCLCCHTDNDVKEIVFKVSDITLTCISLCYLCILDLGREITGLRSDRNE